jgi:hypothetical protein
MLREVSRRTKTLPQTIVAQVTKAVEKELKTSVGRDTGGDSRLSGMGNARVSTKTEIVGASATVGTIRPARRTTGMWVILDEGTRAHTIRPRRRNKTNALHIGDAWEEGPVRVSGSPAKGTWKRAIARVRPDLERIGRAELTKVLG